MASRPPSREKRGYWLSASLADRSTRPSELFTHDARRGCCCCWAFLAAASSRSSCRIICSSVTAAAASLSATPTDDAVDVGTVRKDDDAASAPTSRRCIVVDVESTPWQKLRMPLRRRMV
ncbi:Os01g0260301 [Oryza sativa Japonica Group]|uniref:Os01g0260301 protein n=1 Tax=Oryza sativa subsp. japonica TaxID=39947 RepID=A0A0N7KCP8_ORYSJ|nr:Os01g0260301 [Oryza sativa Japonica Group]